MNGRDFNSLLAITPGVQRQSGGGISGHQHQRFAKSSSTITSSTVCTTTTGITGIPPSTRSAFWAYLPSHFPPDAIEELSVQETPSAEFGVKGGAPILLNMKSGTNTWHGRSYLGQSQRHRRCGHDFANPIPTIVSHPAKKPTPIHNNQFHANIGGPIIKDKAFLFLFYEGQRNKSLAVSARNVPTPEKSGSDRRHRANGLTIDPVGQTLLNYFPTVPEADCSSPRVPPPPAQ